MINITVLQQLSAPGQSITGKFRSAFCLVFRFVV